MQKKYSHALGIEYDLNDDGSCTIDGVCYSEGEVRLLMNSKGKPEVIRAVHAIKKVYDGELLSYGPETKHTDRRFSRESRRCQGKTWDAKKHRYVK